MVAVPKTEGCLCDLTDSLQEPEYNVSRHLKVLRGVGLLSVRKEGRWVYHRINLEKEMKPYYALIAKLPDSEKVFAEDLRRFKNELNGRANQRCKKDGSNFEKKLNRTNRQESV